MLGLVLFLALEAASPPPRVILECDATPRGALNDCRLVGSDCDTEAYVDAAIAAGDALTLPPEQAPETARPLRIDFTCEALKRYRDRTAVQMPFQGEGVRVRRRGPVM